ncbi:MAG: hypothetical protein WC342_05080 [Methanoregula sp.]
MRRMFTCIVLAGLLVLLACAAGCTSSSSSAQASAPSSASTAATTAASSQAATAATETTASDSADTTISVHFNDYSCITMKDLLGVDYLYPDEKYSIQATTPGAGTITPNLLVLDVGDNTKLVTVKPVWDSVQKTWVYEGIVPLVKLMDITSPQEKTFTIKKQGYYYICIDDRKETGASEAVYQVPVRVTKV